jgi:hypothetical protein
MSKPIVRTAQTSACHQSIRESRSVKIALAAAVFVGILLVTILAFHLGSTHHFVAGPGTIWVD